MIKNAYPRIQVSRIIIAIFCFLMLMPQVRAQSSEEYDNQIRHTSLYAEMTAKADTIKSEENAMNLMHDFINKKAVEKLENPRIMIKWLEDRMKTGNSDIFYAMFDSELYFRTAKGSETIGQMELAKELYKMAYVNARIFEIMAFTDVQRCADSTAQGPIMSFAIGRFTGFQPVKKYFTEEDWKIFANLPLAYEEKFATRPENSVVCQSGMEAYKQILNDPNHTETTVADDKYVGKKIIVKSSTPYQPSFISNDEWQKRRQNVRAQVTEMWAQDKEN